MRIRLLPAGTSSPAGKLADAEIEFGPEHGPLAGLRLTGFAIWEKRSPNARRNVTMPARSYSVNGERRSFALLRPGIDATNTTDAMQPIVSAILAEFERQETEDDDNADRMRGARNIDADNDYTRDQDERRAHSDRLAGMTEEEARAETARRSEAARLASQQPGGVALSDLAPGGRFAPVKATPRPAPLALEF
jgi:hypothetical protein